MKKLKIKYTEELVCKIRVVPDFLPSPDELVAKEEAIKITLLLTKDSIDFFKEETE